MHRCGFWLLAAERPAGYLKTAHWRFAAKNAFGEDPESCGVSGLHQQTKQVTSLRDFRVVHKGRAGCIKQLVALLVLVCRLYQAVSGTVSVGVPVVSSS